MWTILIDLKLSQNKQKNWFLDFLFLLLFLFLFFWLRFFDGDSTSYESPTIRFFEFEIGREEANHRRRVQSIRSFNQIEIGGSNRRGMNQLKMKTVSNRRGMNQIEDKIFLEIHLRIPPMDHKNFKISTKTLNYKTTKIN